MHRYIYLDMDGVLNNHQKNKENQYCGIHQQNVTQFNKILRAYPNTRIVLSSAWRYMIHGGAMTKVGFEYMMKSHGILDTFTIYDITNSDETFPFERVGQITHYYLNTIGITDKVCILDDLLLNFENVYLKDRFVRTDGTKGLTSLDVKKVLRILE